MMYFYSNNYEKGVKILDFKECFSRANLQEIATFIQNGGEQSEIDARTYKQRLEDGRKPLLDFLKGLYADVWEYEKQTSAIVADALGAYEDVYFEVGIKIGARLAYQLFCEDNR